MSKEPVRAGIYCRISQDRGQGPDAVARQEEDCRKAADLRQWRVTEVWTDLDYSASKAGIRRPGFEDALEALRSGTIQALLVWKMDRLARRPKDFYEAIEAAEAGSGWIVAVHDNFDTSTPVGETMAALWITMARVESQHQAQRISRWHKQRAMQGHPHTGGTRPFGYTQDRMRLVDAEARVTEDVTARVLAGESLRSLCFWLNDQGIRTSTGGQWKQQPLRGMLMSPLLAGGRRYKGEWVDTPTVPAVISREQHEALALVLGDPERRKNHHQARSYLLTGIVRCGRCRERLIARPRLGGDRRYVCAKLPGSRACGRLARLAEPVEDTVRDIVLDALQDPALLKLMQPRREQGEFDHLAVLAEAERRLGAAANDYYSGKIGERAWKAAERQLTAQIEEAEGAVLRAQAPSIVDLGVDVRATWEERQLGWRRAVISAVVSEVVVHPAVKGRNRFDPELVELVWRV